MPTRRAIAHQVRAAAAEAQVPGPGRSLPIPKRVAIAEAQSGAEARLEISGTAASLFIIAPGKLGEAARIRGIAQRRGNNVLPARPFTQVNNTATLAAEGEVLGGAFHGLLAGGTFHADFALAGHGLIVDANSASSLSTLGFVTAFNP